MPKKTSRKATGFNTNKRTLSFRKYQPMAIDDLAIPKRYRETLYELFEERRGNILLAGPPGIGKTAIPKLAKKLLDLEVLWRDGTKGGGIDEVKETIASLNLVPLTGSIRCAVFDEADSYSSQALNALRGDSDKHEGFIFLICNNVSKIPSAVRSRYHNLVFDMDDQNLFDELAQEQVRRLQEIFDAEGIFIPDEQFATLVSESECDWRKIERGLKALVNRQEAFLAASSGDRLTSSDEQTDRNQAVDGSTAIPAAIWDAVVSQPDPLVLTSSSVIKSPSAYAMETSELLVQIQKAFEAHIDLPAGAAPTLSAFVLHAHTHQTARTSPILALMSPERECGKTSTLTVLRWLLLDPKSTVNITPAALFELAEQGYPILFDEIDNSDLRRRKEMHAILNAGFDRNDVRVHRAGNRSYNVWCPKMLAGIGQIEAEPLRSRCIVLPMRRSLPDVQLGPITTAVESELKRIRDRAAQWAPKAARELSDVNPLMPDGFRGRLAQKWQPLFAIADMAGPEWGKSLRSAAIVLDEITLTAQETGSAVLADIRAIVTSSGSDKHFSYELASNLRKMRDRPWVTWGVFPERRLAQILGPYGIHPKNIRKGERQAKGYTNDQFADAFRRYLR